MNQSDLSEAVRETAMLASVTIHQWGAERSDASLMEKIKADAGAVGNVGRTVKNLLAGADGALKDTKSAFAAVRAVHYAITLPWVSDPHAERQRGPRLLPTLLWDKYMTEIGKARRTAYAARDAFISDYPALVERAKANLGTMADSVYPSASEVEAAFKISVDLEPIPAGAHFRGLPQQMIEKLGQSLQRKQEAMISAAQAAMWSEVRDRVGHVVARLGDPANRFKSSTIESVRELITLLPGWNVTCDERVAGIAQDLDEMLAGIRAEDLRDDARTRTTVVGQAQAVVDKLSQWGL